MYKGQMCIVKGETAQAEWGWRHALYFFLQQFFLHQQHCSDQTATKHISFPFPRTVYTLHPPLPPSQYFPASTCSAVESLLCRKSFTNSTSYLPACYPPSPPGALTYRNIHTSRTKDVERHQKMISHRTNLFWCWLCMMFVAKPGPSPHIQHQVTFPGESSPNWPMSGLLAFTPKRV